MTDDIDEFEAYLNHLAQELGHADRHAGLKGYCSGLVLPLSRKSVEPMAAHIDPLHASAKHQSLHHFVAKAEWSDKAIMQRVREWVMPALGAHAAEEAGYYWIIDDTGFPKKGRHSVGVARQYCGQLGKQDNCQVAVSLSIATQRGSLPIAWQLYVRVLYRCTERIRIPLRMFRKSTSRLARRQLGEGRAAHWTGASVRPSRSWRKRGRRKPKGHFLYAGDGLKAVWENAGDCLHRRGGPILR